MLKITGGQWRGRTVPSSTAGPDLRPTTGLVREAWFNRVQTRLNQASFLDLFAGTGLMGLEALSRGAASVLAVEKERQHAAQIEQNYRHFALDETQVRVLRQDSLPWSGQPPAHYGLLPFDLIYMDPPYAYPHYDAVIANLLNNGWLADGGVLGVEADKSWYFMPQDEIMGLTQTRKEYGDTVLLLISPLDRI